MRLQPFCIVVLGLALAGTVAAQEPIRRCIGSSGEPVFTDQPCNAITPQAGSDVPQREAPASITRTCATSASELRDRIADAFAARNALALSGLLLWDGYRRGDATAVLQDLARLVAEPLVAIDVGSDALPGGFGADDRADAAGSRAGITIRTARNTDRVPFEAQAHFELVDQGGCWWLLPAS